MEVQYLAGMPCRESAKRGESAEVELVRSCFQSLSAGDFDSFERALAADASWRSVAQLEGRCDGRKMIVEVMRRNAGGGLRGSIDDLEQHGSCVVVGFRPNRAEQPPNRPLDDGVAYVVVTIAGDEIVEIQGCEDRAQAVAYAGAEWSGRALTIT